MTDTPQTDTALGRDRRLADVLRGARQAKGWELSDVATRTHVRKEYLAALEEARYESLPEDIYAKNFVRLYAQAVGVPTAKALELYTVERRGASVPTLPNSSSGEGKTEDKPDRAEAAPRPATSRPAAKRRARPGLAVGAWLPTLLLVVAVVGLALWGFNNLLFRPARQAPPVADTAAETTTETTDADAPAADTTGDLGAAGADTGTESPATGSPEGVPLVDESLSLFTLTTDPPGAEVTLDGFPLPGTTPISGQPLTPGVGRTLRVTLPGYETYEAPIDVSNDLRLSVTLTPVGAAESETEADAGAVAGAEAAVPGQLTVNVDDTTWLEAYASTQRGVGERLVYTTVQPGATFTFDLPVYLHTGNAAGVLVTKDGQDLGPMGSSGEVVSRAYLP